MADEHEKETEVDETKGKDDTDAKSEELGDGGKRALESERRARRAAESRLKELESKVKESEDAEKTELERLQGQVADLTKKAEAAQATADRFEVAAAKGLSLAQARRLVGSTKEELEQDADEMRSELGLDKNESDDDESKDKDGEDKGIGRPRERMKPGASNEEDEQPDPAKLADSILGSS
jgi:hypothetical protein